MLHELATYGEAQGLAGRPGFAAKQARWLISLAESGVFVGILDERRDYPMAPNLGQPELVGGSTARSHFLLDSLAVVARYASEDDPKAQQKHANFVALLRAAADVCPPCALCAAALEDEETRARIQAELAVRKAKPTDTATFVVGTTHLPEETAWHGWWQEYRATLRAAPAAASEEGEMICFVTGDVVTPAATHAKIMGLSQVGGQPSGASLISFDKEAFSSYGFEQSANAACSEEAVARYAGAMQHLVNKAPRPLGGTLMLHWFDRAIPDEYDPFRDLTAGGDRASEEASAALKARRVLEAVRQGTRPELTRNRYSVLQIAGAGGRITLRDWFTGDFKEMVENINIWYDDLQLIGPSGGEVASPDKLAAILIRLVPYRPGEAVNKLFDRINSQLPPLIPRLWRAILQNTPLPDAAAQAALAYVRSKQLRSDDEQSSSALDRIACSLLKAWLIRRAPSPERRVPMDPKVNKEHPSPAYQAGRLLAVLAALQSKALGDVGAGVVQRYYAAASSTPALVVGRMVRNAQYHLDRLEKGGVVHYQKLIAEIMSRLGDALPTTLDLQGQTLFALGYYQQQADLFTRKDAGVAASADEALPESTSESTPESTSEFTTGDN